MKLNKIGEVWNSANRLLGDFIGLLSSKIFATMATWRNYFSSQKVDVSRPLLVTDHLASLPCSRFVSSPQRSKSLKAITKLFWVVAYGRFYCLSLCSSLLFLWKLLWTKHGYFAQRFLWYHYHPRISTGLWRQLDQSMLLEDSCTYRKCGTSWFYLL